MRSYFRIAAVAVLAVTSAVAAFDGGCAVQRSKAPQISAATAGKLNVAAQVDQANKDYQTFYKDVGDAQRAGQLTADQVATLNAIGSKEKKVLEDANDLLKTYAANGDQSVATQISSLVVEAASLYTQAYTARATMLAGK